MEQKRGDPRRIARISCLTIVVMCAFGLITLPITCRLQPYDSWLIGHFRAHRTELDQLVAMAQEDQGRFTYIRGDYSTYTNGKETYEGHARLSEQRLTQYRRLLRQAGVQSIARQDRGIEIEYYVSGITLAVTEVKGFLYSTRSLGDLESDLGGGLTKQQGCRQIEGNWYLFYSEYNG